MAMLQFVLRGTHGDYLRLSIEKYSSSVWKKVQVIKVLNLT